MMEMQFSEKDRENISYADKIRQKSEMLGIRFCTIADKEYPKALRNIENRPAVLYYKGNIDLLNKKRNIAVVGSRDCSEKGRILAYRTGVQLAKRDITVVNGLALGCDAEAVRGTLDADGKCVVVMPGGLDEIVPRANRQLAERIFQSGGCVLSEYPIGKGVQKRQYVERDRIQSGVSEAVLVIEAEEKSGTMHTAEYAMKQYRRLACYHYELLERASGNRYLEQIGSAHPIQNEDGLQEFINNLTKTEFYEQMSFV